LFPRKVPKDNPTKLIGSLWAWRREPECPWICEMNALIIGATGGLGAEVARLLKRKGHKIFLSGRDKPALAMLGKELGSKSFSADITDEKQVKALLRESRRELGTIDLLLHSAGYNDRKPFLEYSAEEWDRIFDINTRSVFLTSKELYKNNPHATLAVISSMAGLFPAKHYSLYCASKHAVEGYLKSIMKEVEGRVIIFHPYRLMTDFHKNYKIPSNEKHMISPRLYAQYVVARIEGSPLSFFYFWRNWLLWGIKGLF